MLSERALKYLDTLERVPAVRDEKPIREIFDKTGVPAFEKIIEFQMRFGGIVEFYGLNKFIWGVLHEIPEEYSFLKPNELDFFVEGEEYFFTCANCHCSDSWSLDTKGVLYWCGHKKALSFEKKIERDAAVTEIFSGRNYKNVEFELPVEQLVETLIPKIESGLIAEASDEDQKIYYRDNFYLALDCGDGRVTAYLVGDEIPAWLKPIPFEITST
jgi:hypothetical protein